MTATGRRQMGKRILLADLAANRVWRSTLVLSAAAMYIMWAITFLAQLHPLISPVRNDLRPELNGGR